MKNKLLLIVCLLGLHLSLWAQEGNLPYRQLPAPPASLTAGAVAARMVDGLGFRYYWATEGLREQDYDYRPAADVRSIKETLQHIYGLSQFMLKALHQEVADQPGMEAAMRVVRQQTLQNLATASAILQQADEQTLQTFTLPRGDTSLPFWYVLNGPLADAIYHTGQVVAFRRAAGNPVPAGVSVLMGTKK